MYFGISDHSQSAVYAGGLREADIMRQHQEIDQLNEALKPFRIFKGIEADILVDGQLDYPNEILSWFDFVIASVHSRFSIPRSDMTKRIIRAIENPYTTILAHPTGRLLLSREGYDVDITEVLRAAAANGVVIEVNCNPRRMELDWQFLDEAVKLGVTLAVCPDAHSIRDLDYVTGGIRVMNKAGIPPESILNTRSASELAEYFAKRKP